MPFVIDNIEFKQGSPNVVRFRIVSSDREIQYGSGSFQYIEVSLSSDLDLKEAIAVAAENAATDLRTLAGEAENLAAGVRGGSIRTPET